MSSASDSDRSFEDDEAETAVAASAKTKRARVKRACVNCRKSKSACDGERPCKRCVRTELQSTCQDHIPPKHRRRRIPPPGPDGVPVLPPPRAKSEKKSTAPRKAKKAASTPSPASSAKSNSSPPLKKVSPLTKTKASISPISPEPVLSPPLATARSAFSIHPSVSSNSISTSLLSSPLLSSRSEQSHNPFPFPSPAAHHSRFAAYSSSAPYSSTILSVGSPTEDLSYFVSPSSGSFPPSSASTASASSGDSPPPVLPPSQYTQNMTLKFPKSSPFSSMQDQSPVQAPFAPIDPPLQPQTHSASSTGTVLARKDVPSWFLITEEFALQTLAMHAVVTSSFTPTRQMITAMAWVVHNTAHMEHELELAGIPLASEARQPLQCICHQWKHPRARSSRSHIPSLSPTASSGTASVSFYSSTELARFGLQNFQVPHSLPIDPTQALVNFLHYHDQHEASVKALPFDFLPALGSPARSSSAFSPPTTFLPLAAVSSSDILSVDGGLFGGKNASDDTVHVYIPPISCPPEPTRAEVSYYSAINHWRTMAPVQRALQHFYSKMQPYALEMQFSAEQALCRLLPFAAAIIPLYPSSFLVPGWANEQFAVALGYPAEEMRINSFSDFFRILDPSMLEDGFRAFRELIVTGKNSKTLHDVIHDKTGRRIEVVTTVCVRYFECMPMMFVMYCQERPAGDATILGPSRKASRADVTALDPQLVSLLTRNA